mgnify:CR=1 FL=1
MKKLLLYFLTLQILLFGCRHGEKTVESGYDDGYADVKESIGRRQQTSDGADGRSAGSTDVDEAGEVSNDPSDGPSNGSMPTSGVRRR